MGSYMSMNSFRSLHLEQSPTPDHTFRLSPPKQTAGTCMKENRINEDFPWYPSHPIPSQFPLVFSLYLLLLPPQRGTEG